MRARDGRKQSQMVVIAVVIGTVVGCDGGGDGVLPGAVVGLVCDPVTGRPEANARITAERLEEGPFDDDELRETRTDENGFFFLSGVYPGPVAIVATGEAFTTRLPLEVETLATAQAVDDACADIPRPPSLGTLEGLFCDAHTGTFLSDAVVTIINSDGTTVVTRTAPGTDTFQIGDITTGTKIVQVDAITTRRAYVVDVVEGESTFVGERTCAAADPAQSTFVFGRVCAAEDASLPLAGAEIRVTSTSADGTVIREGPALSTSDGAFLMDPVEARPGTTVEVSASKDGSSFTWRLDSLAPRTTNVAGVDLTPDGCQVLEAGRAQRVLVVQGLYDHVDLALFGDDISLDRVDAAEPGRAWAEAFFASPENVADYDVVFVGCGVDSGEFERGLSQGARQTLRGFIADGGILYASDWAYELIEQAFPNQINFLGRDQEHQEALFSVGAPTVDATVVDPALRDTVGETITVAVPSPPLMAVMSAVNDDVDVMLWADISYARDGDLAVLPDAPLAVRFRHGFGSVIYTSFHLEDGLDDAEAGRQILAP